MMYFAIVVNSFDFGKTCQLGRAIFEARDDEEHNGTNNDQNPRHNQFLGPNPQHTETRLNN